MLTAREYRLRGTEIAKQIAKTNPEAADAYFDAIDLRRQVEAGTVKVEGQFEPWVLNELRKMR